MRFIIHGNIKNLIDEAYEHALNLNKDELDITTNKIYQYIGKKSNTLYKRFLRLKVQDCIDTYNTKISVMNEASYLLNSTRI